MQRLFTSPTQHTKPARGSLWRPRWWVLTTFVLTAVSACADSAVEAPQQADTAAADATADATAIDSPDVPAASQPLQPVVSTVSPQQGLTGGLELVTIEGQHLGAAVAVSFGGTAGLDLEVLSNDRLQVQAPPRPPGIVDLVITSNGRPEAVAKNAYLYRATVSLQGISPKSGPVQGGTVLTVQGQGFAPSTHFAIGGRLVADAVVVDSTTAVLTTPPGQPGPADVVAANDDGQAELKNAFVYQAVPTLTGLSPTIAPMAGGATLELTGSGLTSKLSGVALQLGPSQVLGTVVSVAGDGTSLRFLVPPVSVAGPWDVVFANPLGSAVLAKSLYFSAEGDGLAVVSVAPNQLAANQLAPVQVGVTGTFNGAQLGQMTLQFGSQPAAILTRKPVVGLPAAQLVVQPPPLPPGTPLPHTVAVSVAIGEATTPYSQSFTYAANQPLVASVQPPTLPSATGGQVLLALTDCQGLGSVVQVKIGGLVTTGLMILGDATADSRLVQVQAPPGAPGGAPVEVRFASGAIATTTDKFGYVADAPFVAAVTPALGARAGGTWVWLLGGGLKQLQNVYLGSNKAQILQVVDDGKALIATPPGDVGWASLTATFTGGQKSQIAKAFLYFDPSDTDLGTWGEPIDGCINVTVVKKGKTAPIAGVTVSIGNDPETSLQGKTDANGQVTLCCVAPVCCVGTSCSGGLTGPVDVHASKAGYSAGSIVAVAVENVTIRLQEFPPPSDGDGNGGGDGEPVPPNAVLQGKVLGANKYLQLPLGSCQNTPASAGNCKTCSSNADCLLGATCEVLQSPTTTQLYASATTTPTQRYCAQPCAGNSDCPASFECRAVGADLQSAQFRCTPLIGTPQTRCESASPSIWGGALPAGEGGIATADGSFTVPASPGDTAVVCRAGYQDKLTGQFVPLAMGLATKIFVLPGQTKTDIQVPIQIALNRKLRVLMDRIPMGPDAKGLRQLTAGLDLGADGYIPLGQASTFALTDTLEFSRQPDFSALSGDLSDITYALYGGLSNQWGGAPNSTSSQYGIDPRGLDHYAVLAAGAESAQESSGAMGTVYAGDFAADLRVVVGESGRIWYWTGGGFTQQASPTSVDLRAVWLGTDGSGWIGGNSGVVLKRTPLGWQAVAGADNRNVIGLTGRNNQDAWALLADNGLWHWNGSSWQAFAGPIPMVPQEDSPTANPGQPVAAKRLRTIWQSPAGLLYVAGDDGAVLRADPGLSPTAPLQWTTLQTQTWRTVWHLNGSSDSDFFAVGDRGLWLHWDGKAFASLPSGTLRSLRVVRTIGTEVHALGSQGTWLRWNGPSLTDPAAFSDVSQPLLRVDLSAVVPTFDGGAAAAGQAGVILGPYLELPWIELPVYGAKALGKVVKWGANPGVVPTFNIVRLADSGYTTRWEMFVRGGVTQVDLPDFEALGEANPLPGGPTYVRVWRVYAPGQEIDAFSAKNLNTSAWVSWSYNVTNLTEPPLFQGVGTAGMTPGALPGQVPGSPPTPQPKTPKDQSGLPPQPFEP